MSSTFQAQKVQFVPILLTLTKCTPHKSNFGTSRKWSVDVFATSRKHTISVPSPLWCATPDSCRNLSGSVLSVAAARVVFPPALQGLNAEQIKAVIKRAPLGRYDRKIARLRYVDQLCQVDIAARVPYCRTSIGNRLKIIDEKLDERSSP